MNCAAKSSLGKALKPAAIGFGIMTAIPLLAVIAIVCYFKPDVNPLLNPSIYIFCAAMGTAGGTFGILTSGARLQNLPLRTSTCHWRRLRNVNNFSNKRRGFIKPGA